MQRGWGFFALVFCVGCGGSDSVTIGQTEQSLNKDFDVDFGECTEFAGIGFVPRENAEPLVPPSYALAGDEENAIVVVRVADCASVSVDGVNPTAARTAQVGVTLVGPDETADINNYTVWFATDLGVLQGKLQAAGVESDNDESLAYGFTPGGGGEGELSAETDPPRAPPYAVDGTAVVPGPDETVFVASWWADGVHGTVRMRTEFPDIRFSGASTTLTTPAGSELADLVGGTSLTFALLDSYNAFETAALEVRNVED